MVSVYHMKLWAVPLIEPIVDKGLFAGSRKLSEAAALRMLNELGGAGEHWMRLLGNGFYMYGIGEVWTGIISVQDVGHAPG